MKVLFISRIIYSSGVTTAMTELMEQLITLGVDVRLWHGGFESDESEIVYRVKKFGNRVSRIPMPVSKNKFRYFLEYFKFTLDLKRQLADMNPDLIHLHSAVLGLAFKLNKIDIVQTIQQSKLKLGVFRITPRMEIAVSEDILLESRIRFGVPSENSVCIHNPVNYMRFSERDDQLSDEFKNKYELEKFNFIISTVANIEYRKGHDILINAVNKLVELNHRVIPIVVMAGRILDTVYFNSIMQASKVKVVHIGFCNPMSLYCASDVHVLASRREAFPVSILESMAAGVCSIRSNTEGSTDQINDGITGFLFENEDSRQLCGILNSLFINSRLKNSVAKNGSAFVKDNFSGHLIARKTLDEYLKIMKEKGE